jgi:hypothetical protein
LAVVPGGDFLAIRSPGQFRRHPEGEALMKPHVIVLLLALGLLGGCTTASGADQVRYTSSIQCASAPQTIQQQSECKARETAAATSAGNATGAALTGLGVAMIFLPM